MGDDTLDAGKLAEISNGFDIVDGVEHGFDSMGNGNSALSTSNAMQGRCVGLNAESLRRRRGNETLDFSEGVLL